MTRQEFELREEHIMLLQHSYWEWSDCETGAPAINPKRPYGNSWVPGDVAKILGLGRPDDEDATDEFIDRMMAIHRETETALEIILHLKTFEPGRYVRDGEPWSRTSWRKAT